MLASPETHHPRQHPPSYYRHRWLGMSIVTALRFPAWNFTTASLSWALASSSPTSWELSRVLGLHDPVPGEAPALRQPRRSDCQGQAGTDWKIPLGFSEPRSAGPEGASGNSTTQPAPHWPYSRQQALVPGMSPWVDGQMAAQNMLTSRGQGPCRAESPADTQLPSPKLVVKKRCCFYCPR